MIAIAPITTNVVLFCTRNNITILVDSKVMKIASMIISVEMLDSFCTNNGRFKVLAISSEMKMNIKSP